MRTVRTKWIVSAVLIVALGALTSANARDKNQHWVGTWACSPQLGDAGNAPPAPGLNGSTLRQIAHVSIGGKQIRVRFSNAFGTTPLTIVSVDVAQAAGGSTIRPQSDRAITFQGRPSVTIPAGALMVSDPLDFDLAPLSDLAVTIYLDGVPNGITTHPGARATSYLLAGNAVSGESLPGAAETDHWYFLSGIDVMAKSSAGAIAVLGDSITDGRNSTTNKNGRWPDVLARRLQANKATAAIGVLNEGIGGNRVLRDGLGQNALARLDRDVLTQSGVRWLVVLEGINDIGLHEQPRTAQELIAAYEQVIVRAHALNIRVYGATILPYSGSRYFTPEGEVDRQTVNQWIRTSGKLDGVIDFDAVTRDPQNPSHLSAAADSGDHLHPTDGGYKVMADAVELKLFEK